MLLHSLTIAQYGATLLSSIFGYNQSFTAFLDIISSILVFFVCILYICMYLYYLNHLLVLLSIDELIEPKMWQRMASNMKTFNIKSQSVSQNISGKKSSESFKNHTHKELKRWIGTRISLSGKNMPSKVNTCIQSPLWDILGSYKVTASEENRI